MAWNYIYASILPHVVAVSFQRGRAVALFTLWSPPGWHTTTGLNVGDESFRVKDLYGILVRTRCRWYIALSLIAPNGARTNFYLQNKRIWGLGLTARGSPVCRDARPA